MRCQCDVNICNLVPKNQVVNLVYGALGTQFKSVFHEKHFGRFFAILNPAATYLFFSLSLISFTLSS